MLAPPTFHVLGVLLVNEVGEVTPIVKDHVKGLPIREHKRLVNAPDVLLISLSFPGINRDTSLRNGCGSVVLG